ncbi:sulfotransferase [Allosediminivita pacifica]|uniref:Sulfotransferase family protein n=1 Tax=Allosediminivita pacifica TaxID=1267769 RepID=A0A2T6B9L5_9RHOB|nr:sulfotransferase [Allosediminivita pacifica]PTX52718.1 sulfotransferase family protein [Allosediminivita pacifica]GGA96394.1 hypothetical protein GCM10011324_03360 [Allosediminivita pacifica]
MLPHRYVFVGGLHRSGTSLVARLIAELDGVAGITDAPVPENEGVYLQGAIPHTARHGRPMHFATDPAQHHVEGGSHDRLEVRQRIEADWAPFFGQGHWRVEKSPVNLTRMRLYQQLFPLSQFVVVVRHPEAVAAAVAKWVDMPPAEMIDHWLDAHETVTRDLPYLHSVMVLRYEDLVSAPGRTLGRLATFLDLGGARALPGDEPLRDGNLRYSGAPGMTPEQAARAERWGYGPGMAAGPTDLPLQHALTRIVQEVRGIV